IHSDAATTRSSTLRLHDALPISSTIDPDQAPGLAPMSGGFMAAWHQGADDADVLATRIDASGTVEDAPPITVSSSTNDQAHQARSEEHTSELQSLAYLVCRLLLE